MDELGKGVIFDKAAGRQGARAKDEQSLTSAQTSGTLIIETYNVSGLGSLLPYIRRGTSAH
eukprot:6696316-Heterocapsa_arctica.AAC.1